MNHLDEFNIEIPDGSHILRRGQQLTGLIRLKPKETWIAKCLWIEFYGRASIKANNANLSTYRQRRGRRFMLYDLYTEKTELFFKVKKCLWGFNGLPDESENSKLMDNPCHLKILAAKSHQFSFAFFVPNDELPSSIEGDRFYVRYSLRACIEKLNGRDYFMERILTLRTPVDVSSFNFIIPPLSYQAERVVTSWCCHSRPVRLLVSINRNGYYPGEDISFSVKATNKTRKILGKIKVKLYQVLNSRFVRGPQRKCYARQQYDRKLGPGDTIFWQNGRITIPNIPPTIQACALARIDYEVQAIVPIPFDHDIIVAFKIVIGSEPVQTTLSHQENTLRQSTHRIRQFSCDEIEEITRKFKNTMTWENDDDFGYKDSLETTV
ncbi:uncharacterized protein TRIADDRAFT_60106 [Trichoplax adhaerens]|uniref:Arrestin C-terminal-like domain-containing protein n=1 Tax=Trichoplax adhaerens TaxID=10228 RepID=B3S7B5_TRIAD|nr:hypothetical protein TRIADDRAFT_60106 [Trichoplax adhaerens]EDV21459.1 hypothetical protein TRIADDRAFT_60106 [Trichoplax adhaerens]|eukprot:XP_002116059.1 hypothetical protein TRIADDRAFT_60106 [Trichoplax adhaerens]